MRPADASRPVTCPYGRKGTSWATGEHGGIDYGCPVGDPVYAMWGGTVIGIKTATGSSGTTWGAAYGYQIIIDHDKLPDGSPGLWAVYAHLSQVSVAVGARVSAGQRIGKSGQTGNVSGPHLHVEVQKDDSWKQGNYVNPQPWIDAGSAAGPFVTKNIYSNKLGYGEPSNGDADSDTVKELQEQLNRKSIPGRLALKVTGVYDKATDAEVRRWQSYIGNAPDQPQMSYLGPKQIAEMFPASIYTVHDAGLPAIATSTAQKSTLGEYLKSKGFKVEESLVPVGRPTTWDHVKFLMVHHTASPETNTAASDAAWIRSGNKDAPLAQLMLDQTGMVWICCRERDGQPDPGRASHAGTGTGFGVPTNTMNEVSLGIECKADGTKPLASYPVMYSTLIRLLAVLRQKYQVPKDNVIGHKEWSTTGKKDPLDSMAVIRTQVETELNGSTPIPPPDPGVPMKLYDYKYLGKPANPQTVGTSYAQIDQSSWTPPGDGFLISMLYFNAAYSLKNAAQPATIRVRAVRAPYKGEGSDYTGYSDFLVGKGTTEGTFVQTHLWFEWCEAGRKIHWEMDRSSGFSSVKLTTRYTKYFWISKLALDGLTAVAQAQGRSVSPSEIVAAAVSSFEEM